MSDMINVSQCTNLTDRRMLHQYIIKELTVNTKARENFKSSNLDLKLIKRTSKNLHQL